ncbi:hypothetical protein [Polymorphospora rubra]|uniref:Uncharacterized protein n=1 Tax=Polymorphospora rubra TaxID=338584 RepID=A0A810MT11_9ACTN|nr:hypothetical protein [Polymorphospora rubra]BCJ64171.1 hypothetical protein Prubr_11920 [Polymorphospora rubra]
MSHPAAAGQDTTTASTPGRVHTALLVAAVLLTPATWTALGIAAHALHGEPVEFVGALAIAFAAALVPATATLAVFWIYRRDAAHRHRELLATLESVAERALTRSEAVADTVDRLAAALPGGAAKVRDIRR